MFWDLRSFIEELEASGELTRISTELSPQYEVAAAIKYVAEKKGTAALFENVKGYDIPVIGNLFGNRKRLAIALGVVEDEVSDVYAARKGELIKPKVVTEAVAGEVVIDRDIDICKLIPVLIHHGKDAGPYFTAAITVAKDPETGERGVGVYRLQVKDKDTINVHLVTPPLSEFLAKAEGRGEPLHIAVACSVDPLTFFTGCISVPQGVDKFEVAGGLAQAPIELVKCRTVDVEVPANAEFVLEGELIPHRREPEGPFGASTGYYTASDNPVAKIKHITHRRNPIYHDFMPFGPEEDILLGLPLEVDALHQLRGSLPFVQGVHFRGLSGLVIVQISKGSESDAMKVMEPLFSNFYIKVVVVTDGDVDIWNPKEVGWALSRVRFNKDLVVRSDLPGCMVDPSAIAPGIHPVEFIPMITKVGIDATKPLAELDRFEKIDVPASVKEKIAATLRGLV